MSKVKRKKKEKKNIEQGIAHIQASFNNTIVSISDVRTCDTRVQTKRHAWPNVRWLRIFRG